MLGIYSVTDTDLVTGDPVVKKTKSLSLGTFLWCQQIDKYITTCELVITPCLTSKFVFAKYLLLKILKKEGKDLKTKIVAGP